MLIKYEDIVLIFQPVINGRLIFLPYFQDSYNSRQVAVGDEVWLQDGLAKDFKFTDGFGFKFPVEPGIEIIESILFKSQRSSFLFDHIFHHFFPVFPEFIPSGDPFLLDGFRNKQCNG